MEEYRFQAQYNWSRTQQLPGFSAAVLVAARALVGTADVGAAFVFFVGMVAVADVGGVVVALTT